MKGSKTDSHTQMGTGAPETENLFPSSAINCSHQESIVPYVLRPLQSLACFLPYLIVLISLGSLIARADAF